jgi:hypothetical protein
MEAAHRGVERPRRAYEPHSIIKKPAALGKPMPPAHRTAHLGALDALAVSANLG